MTPPNRQWDAQIPVFRQRYRVLRYDTRGHGGSAVPPGPYALADLGQDVLSLLDMQGISRALSVDPATGFA